MGYDLFLTSHDSADICLKAKPHLSSGLMCENIGGSQRMSLLGYVLRKAYEHNQDHG